MAKINKDVKQQCQIIHDTMMLQWKSTAGHTAPIVGVEREIFIGNILSHMIPPNYRIGTGVIVDSYGYRSTQTDIVVEYPFGVRFPIGTGNTNLYLAENVALTIEVKSNATKQWPAAKKKIEDIYGLKRRLYPRGKEKEEIVYIPKVIPPVFIVSYTGPKKIDTLQKWIREFPRGVWPAGILIIESGIYLGTSPACATQAVGAAESIFAFMTDVSEWMRFDIADTWNLGHYLDSTKERLQ